MDYKLKKNDEKKEEFFIYKPRTKKSKGLKRDKKVSKDSPFEKLTELRFR